MRGVPPETDRLMWAVAENGSEQSIVEFASRHPEHRAELIRRVNMVASLRKQMQPLPRLDSIPRFEPRAPIQAPNSRAMFLVGALSLAAIAAASYTAVSILSAPSHTMPKPVIPLVKVDPVRPPQTVFANPRDLTPAPPVGQAQPNEAEPPLPRYRAPQARIAFKDENLASALQLIAAANRMKLELGPGFVDQKISVDYRDVSPLEALQAMAKEFAFTVFDEGNGSFLVIPVSDKEGQPKPDLDATPGSNEAPPKLRVGP